MRVFYRESGLCRFRKVEGTSNRDPLQRKIKRLVFADEFQAALVKEFSPLEVMHAIMLLRTAKGDYDGALAAADKAAPYCHARLNAAEVKVSHALADRTTEQLAADIEMIRTKIALAKQAGGLLSGPLNPVIDLSVEQISAGGGTGDEKLRKYNDGGVAPVSK
jgi:hypothetical protein